MELDNTETAYCCRCYCRPTARGFFPPTQPEPQRNSWASRAERPLPDAPRGRAVACGSECVCACVYVCVCVCVPVRARARRGRPRRTAALERATPVVASGSTFIVFVVVVYICWI